MEGVDYDETFAPVACMESIKILLTLACQLKFKLYHMDVKTAFLNGLLKEDVYMAQPKGFIDPYFSNHVLYLKKALYRLKQAPRGGVEPHFKTSFSRGEKHRHECNQVCNSTNDSNNILSSQKHLSTKIFKAHGSQKHTHTLNKFNQFYISKTSQDSLVSIH